MNNANNDANDGGGYYYHDAYQIYELFEKNNYRYDNTGYNNITTMDYPNIVTAIKDLFIRVPFESKRTFSYGQTLLHKCYENPMPFSSSSSSSSSSNNVSSSNVSSSSIIDVVLEFHPEALKKEDEYGKLPIHYLLSPNSQWCEQDEAPSTSTSTTSIKDLLEQILILFPDSIVSTTSLRDGGQLPLHLVCQRTTTTTGNNDTNQLVDVIGFLIQCYPDACHYRDNYGKFPFDYAFETAIIAIENTYTTTSTNNTTFSSTSSPHIQILQLLLQQNPILLSFPSLSVPGIPKNNNNEDEFGNTRTGNGVRGVGGGVGGGDLPIHRIIKECSLLYNKSKSKQYDPIIELLLNGYEGCLRIQGSEYSNFMTPLMLSCTCNNSVSQIYTLLRKWPEQIQLETSQIIFDNSQFNGELLYFSLAMVKSITILDVKNWIDYYSNNSIVLKKDIHGRLPIHYAVLSKSNDAYTIIHYLLFGTTTAATAITNDSNIANIAIQQLSTADKNGRLPIHYASASPTCHETILKLLIQIHPDGLLQKDKNGRLPWHYGECSRQDLIFEMTTTLHPNHNECNLDFVPDEIQWDILSVKRS